MNLVYLKEPDANWEKVKALIAAAPDMLEACEGALKTFEDWGLYGPEKLALIEAIKKARGEQ